MTARTIFVRPEIRALRPYRLADEGPVPIRAKLDFNESPDDVPEEIRSEVLGRLKARRWGHYPEFGARCLKKAIAESIGRSPDEIVVGSGSGEAILAAVSVFAGGGTLVLAPPTFSLYGQIAAIASARVVSVCRTGEDFAVDEPAFLSQAAHGVPLLCSPNNPTGGVSGRVFVEKLLDEAPVALLDQAYVEFAEGPDDLTGLVASRPNLVVFRTLSKAYAAAGFRIGYAVASPDLAREIDKAVLPFNVDLAAEELALALLARPDSAKERVARVVKERERVAAALRALGCEVVPSRANFLLVAPRGGDAVAAREGLRARGVLVRDLTALVPGRLRVSIGTPEENDLFLAVLAEVS
jgi:histidinol-phosphate aminotransferase